MLLAVLSSMLMPLAWLVLAHVIGSYYAVSHLRLQRWTSPNSLLAGIVVLVTAHPDDEAMFFAPTLAHLATQADPAKVYVLCLSTGNHDGLGSVRQRELMASCQRLGVPRHRVRVIDDPRLQDGPKNAWSIDAMAEAIEAFLDDVVDPDTADNDRDGSHVQQQQQQQQQKRRGSRGYHQPTTLLTFDDLGVSGHANHIAVLDGVRHVAASRRGRNAALTVLTLTTTGLLRKYIGVFDAWFTRADCPPGLIVVTPDITAARDAMVLHASQYVWFRRLFVLFSRYTWINSYRVDVPVPAAEPER